MKTIIKRTVTFFLLLFFLASLSCCNSMQMLSIENGQVYTERYSLCHIFKNSTMDPKQILPDSLQSFNSNRIYQHLHVILTKTSRYEKLSVDIDTPINKTFSLNPAEFLSSLSLSLLAVHPKLHNRPIKIPTLLQTTVLLV